MLIELRHTVRALLRNLSFTIPVVATVGVAVALFTTTFAVTYGILWRPLPFAGDAQLVRVSCHYGTPDRKPASISPPDFADRAAARSFSSAAAWHEQTAVIGASDPVRVAAAGVTPRFFSTLGVTPLLGTFRLDPETVVLSYGAWLRRFGAAHDVIGRDVIVDGSRHTIAAVARPDFAFPSRDIELWLPLILGPAQLDDSARGNEYLEMVARLAAGATIASAQSEADVLSRRLIDRVPGRRQFLIDSHWHVLITGLRDSLASDVRTPLLLLMIAAALVFAIASANGGALVLARLASRDREAAIRAALGASRMRAALPRIAEIAVTMAAASLIGTSLAVLLSRFVAEGVPWDRPEAIRADAPVLAFAAVLLLALTLVFCMTAVFGPRWTRGGGRSRSAVVARFRSALVVFEVGLATALLIAGALVAESLRNLSAGDPGFRSAGVLTFRVTAPATTSEDDAQVAAFFSEIQRRLRANPHLSAVSATSALPFSRDDETATFHIEGHAIAGTPMPSGKLRMILADFPAAIGIPLLRGRSFDDRDDAQSAKVVMIDEAAAKAYWPNEDPIGRHITYSNLSSGQVIWREIVGICGGIRHSSLGEQPVPHVYLPVAQMPQTTMTFLVRSALPEKAVVADARAAVRAIDARVPIDRVQSLDAFVAASLAQPRIAGAVLTTFSAVALFLTAIGIYGLLAYVVTERRRELAVRMALGANARDMTGFVVRAGVRLAVIGAGIGAIGALLARDVLRRLLVAVSATNPIAYAAVVVTLVVVAALASYIPARRAAMLDPASVLRIE